MKLYVWENVLTDYTDGIAFALADNENEAREMVIKEAGCDHQDFKEKPICIENKKAYAIWGGG